MLAVSFPTRTGFNGAFLVEDGFQGHVASCPAGKESGPINPAQLLVNKLFPVVKSGKVNLSGAVTILEATNNVNAFIDKNARVDAAGNVDVTALLTDRTNTSAVAAATSDGGAAGGSVIYGDYTNHVNAYIGQQAIVNSAQGITVNAQYFLPYPWQINFDSSDVVLTFLTQNLLNLVFSTYAHNSSAGDKFGGAGAVNIQLYDNEPHACIDAGARINDPTTNPPSFASAPPPSASAQQSVTVHANSSVNTLNVVGADAQWNILTQLITNQASQKLTSVTNSLQGVLPQSVLGKLKLNMLEDPKVGIGGAVTYFNYNDSTIADVAAGAVVNATGQVAVTSESVDQVIALTESHGKAQKLAIFGAGSALILNSTTLAYLDSTAHVAAGGQLNLQATNDPRAYNFTGGLAQNASVGIGLSASVAQVNSIVKSFIGPQAGLTGNPSLTFASVANGDTITRSAGSWLTDGFQPGQTILVQGSASNSGTYQIKAISPDGLTLTLVQSNVVTSETTSIVSVIAPNVPATIARASGSWSADGRLQGDGEGRGHARHDRPGQHHRRPRRRRE